MAEKVALDLVINSANSAQTVGEIKQSIKDIKNEMLKVGENSAEFKKLANAAAQAKDKLEDTADAIAALDPGKLGRAFGNLGSSIAGGFQAAQGAMALFGSTGEDVQKAMLKVQAATAFAQGIQSVQDFGKAFKAFWLVLKANPVALILTAVTGLVAGFIALKDKVKIFGDAFDFVSGIIGKGVQAFKDLSDAIGLSSFKTDELREKTKKLNEETLKLSESNTARIIKNYDRQIAVAKAAGKSTIEIEKAKQRDIIITANEQRKLAEQTGQDTTKYIDAALDAINNLEVMKAAAQKEANDKAAKAAEEQRVKELDMRIADWNLTQETAKMQAEWEAQRQEETLNRFEDFHVKTQEERAKDAADAIATAQRVADAKMSVEQSLFQGLSAIGEIATKDQERLQRYQKTLALIQIGIDTAQAISAAVKFAQANPLNAVTFGTAGVAQFASSLAMILTNIAKAKALLTSKNPTMPSLSGGGGGGGGVSAPAPNLNPVSNTSTQINQNAVDQGQGALKVYVTETDITNSQNGVNQIQQQATIE